MSAVIDIKAPVEGVILRLESALQEQVVEGQTLAVLEVMKTHFSVLAPFSGVIDAVTCAVGDTVQRDALLFALRADPKSRSTDAVIALGQRGGGEHSSIGPLARRVSESVDAGRVDQVAKRHQRGHRTARENLADLVDGDSFIEYGQFALAAQRNREGISSLKTRTAADGVITGTAKINRSLYGDGFADVAVVINDYTVLAGTQGFFHHKKIDRILQVASRRKLPIVMYTEGGGGRPGDTDVNVQIAGLNITTWLVWSQLAGIVPRIAVNHGYCFAGNAALFGGADITIATKHSFIGMAGPAMIEGGGLGVFDAKKIGPTEVNAGNGVIDLVADDEAHATALAKQVLGYFQGQIIDWQVADQTRLHSMMPEDRRFTYDVRAIIEVIADTGSFLEIQAGYAAGIIVGFMRIEGRPCALMANDNRVLGGAVGAESAIKASRFLSLCSSFAIPLLSLCDTPGFMVGPDSEEQGAARKMADLFTAGANFTAPLVTIFLRKAYGLGAMAMAGSSFVKPTYSAAWPMGEFGSMGLEGAVKLGFKHELAAVEGDEREALFNVLLKSLYEQGQAIEAAEFLEIDAVIEPSHTRRVAYTGLFSVGR
ncbi:MAG: biotin carboxylase [Porticoccaceae bacterium]|nr:biotin carboxylase [Porticoccaceae bacterium]